MKLQTICCQCLRVLTDGSEDSKYPHGEVKYRIVYRKSGERVEGIRSFNSKADAQQYAAKDPQYSVQAYRVKQGVAEGSERRAPAIFSELPVPAMTTTTVYAHCEPCYESITGSNNG